MDIDCTHIPADLTPPAVTSKGCEDCLAAGKRDWVHLRMCQVCGHIGCCNDSPSTHAIKHFHAVGHALMRSYEPEEDWWYCVTAIALWG
jgi:hypothetical protein